MSTPLMWKAFQLAQSVYGCVMYPHLATVFPKTETLVFETRFKERIPFHLSSCAHFTMLLCVFHFLSRCLLESNFKYFYLIPFYIGLCVFITMHLLLVLLFMSMGDQVWEFLNTSLQLERGMLGDRMKPVGYAAKIGHYKLLSQEIRKLIQGKPDADIVGLLIYGLTILLILIGIFWSPFGVYYNFDPPYFVFEYIFDPMQNQSLVVKITTRIICYTATHWCVAEATRTYQMAISAAMYVCVAIQSFLKAISRIPLSEITLKMYMKLQCIVQIGQNPVRYAAGILMSSGFVILVVGNWLTVIGWRFIPIEVNLSMSFITAVVYLTVSSTIPRVIKFHEESKQMIRNWDCDFIKKKKADKTSTTEASFKLWRKLTQAQRPVTMYWCTSIFQRDTKVNYYSNIMDYTVDTILSFQVRKKI